MTDIGAVLVTGGAGYIGSHAVLALRDTGVPVVVIDDLSTGRRALVPDDVPFIEGSVGDPALVEAAIARHGVDSVMHFAASIMVAESVADPLAYYWNNTALTCRLLQTCVAGGVRRFVFSSTAAAYGVPERLPIDEETPTAPINPYGASKLAAERMLRDAAAAHGLGYMILRYFNVAGADPQGRAGESPPVPSHLVKNVARVAVGKDAELKIFGEDYPTPDGTAVRDYVHVSDLAEVHRLALAHLAAGGASATYNCGYGHGFSVREVIRAAERVLGEALPVRAAPRRPGDPPALFAAADRIRAALGWEPRHDDLEFIVRTAVAWERTLP